MKIENIKISLIILLGMFMLSFISAYLNDTTAESFTVDTKGNIYVLQNDTIFKYNSNYSLVGTYEVSTMKTISIFSSYCKSWFGGLIKKCEYDTKEVRWTIFGIRFGGKTEGEIIWDKIKNLNITNLNELEEVQ